MPKNPFRFLRSKKTTPENTSTAAATTTATPTDQAIISKKPEESHSTTTMSGRLSGKTALVTGASRGIGRATALALAKEGANVVVNYISSSKAAEDVVKEIGAEHSIAIKADATDLSQSKDLIKQAVDKWGKIDILVLNAGLLYQNGALENVSPEDFDKLFAANVKGPFFMVKEAAPYMPSGGRVMLFSSSLTALSAITPNYLLYAATKGAVEQMTRVLAKDLGKKGITVNTISPGPIGTDAYYVGKSEQLVNMQKGFHPMGRLGQPEEVAKTILFVASEDSSWVNGQILRINGGMTVG